jgi:hypothetical protein
MRYIVDLGFVGQDKGKGGKYLFLPPGYTGEAPEGYFLAKPRTYKVWFGVRGMAVDGDTRPAVEAFKKYWRVYPLAQGDEPAADEVHQ